MPNSVSQHQPQQPPAPQSNQQLSQPTGVLFQEQFSGPLPHPQILRQYDQVVPGAADRIIKMAEQQSEHRRDLESRVIGSDIRNSKFGLVVGLTMGIAGLASATIMVVSGKTIPGSTVGLTTIGSMVTAFVFGSQQRRREREGRK